jgi:hypothetical protein
LYVRVNVSPDSNDREAERALLAMNFSPDDPFATPTSAIVFDPEAVHVYTHWDVSPATVVVTVETVPTTLARPESVISVSRCGWAADSEAVPVPHPTYVATVAELFRALAARANP